MVKYSYRYLRIISIILIGLFFIIIFSVNINAEEIENTETENIENTEPENIETMDADSVEITDEIQTDLPGLDYLENIQNFPFQTVTGFSFETYSEKSLAEIHADYIIRGAAIYSSKIIPNQNPDYSMISNGFFISPDGYFLTTYHHINDVFDTATNKVKSDISLKLLTNYSLQILDLSVINIDTKADLVLLKADLNSIGLTETPFVELFNDAEYIVGEALIGIGFPELLASEGSIYPGFLMEISVSEISEQNFHMQKIKSSAIIPNSSKGGLIVNAAGQAVGISGADENSSFNDRYTIVYPVDQIKESVNAMLSEQSTEAPAKLGLVFMSDYDYEKMQSTLNLPQGLYVTKVLANGQAYVSDVRKGDIMIAIDGKLLDSVDDYLEIINMHLPGDAVEIQIYRPRTSETIIKTLYFD